MEWTRRQTLACAVGIGTTALAGCLDDGPGRSLSETPTGSWQQVAHDAANTGVSEVTVPDRGTPAWENGDAWEIPPLVAGDTVFSVATQVDALDARTGETRWSVDLDAETGDATAPAVTDDALILGVAGRVVAFAREDGEKLWETNIDGVAAGPAAVNPDGEVVLVPFERREQGGLVALDGATGDIEWTAQLRVSSYSVPAAIRKGYVYAAGRLEDETSVLRRYSLDGGTQDWETELTEAETPPVVTSAGVFIGDGGRLKRYDHAGTNPEVLLDLTGEERTLRIRALAVAEETAFVLSPEGLFAVSVADGSRRWQASVEPLAAADSICVGNETVVVSVTSDEFDTRWPCVAAFDRADGSTRWYYSVGKSFDPTLGRTAIADDAVYFLSNTVDGIAALGDLEPKG